jgi:RHH-type proline utilization regulon transcriptional repressor/proline dehydrogenase/delta 1-pyrroline-5-carboxylate dehydrogenase
MEGTLRADFESRVRETGLRLYRAIEGESPSFFKREFWAGEVMDWTMKNEDLKVQLFRFIDVFPTLARPESIAQHLIEYFCGADYKFPAPLQFGLSHIAPTSIGGKIIAKSISNNIRMMGKQFIAGVTPQEALPVLEHLRSQGMAFTADLLGEAAVSEQEVEAYFTLYLELLDILSEAQNRWRPLGVGSDKLDWGSTPMINVSISMRPWGKCFQG